MVDANAEIGGRVRYPEIDVSPVMGSSGEIVGQSRNEGIVDDTIFVAVGKEVKDSKSTLIWALQNSKGKKICIIYVHMPAKMVPMPMGGKFPANKVGKKILEAFRDKEQKEMFSILDFYLLICAKVGVRAEKIHIEMDSTIEEGIVELISQHGIGKLVMGAAVDRSYSRKMVEPKSRKANYVRHHAPDYCHILFVCKNYLIYTREGVKQPSTRIEERSSNASDNNQLDNNQLDTGEFDRSSRISFSQSSFRSEGSVEAESVFGSPLRSSVSNDARVFGSSLRSSVSSDSGVFGSPSVGSVGLVEAESVFGSPLRSSVSKDAGVFGSPLRSSVTVSNDAGVFGSSLPSSVSNDARIFGSPSVRSVASAEAESVFGSPVRSSVSSDARVFGSSLRSSVSNDARVFGSPSVRSVGSAEAESVFGSPFRSSVSNDAGVSGSPLQSSVSNGAGERGLKLLALPQSQDENLGSSPPIVLESSIKDHLYDQLERAMMGAENARREAFEESMRRRKAENEALEASFRAQTSERLYYEQLRLRKATEEELAKGEEELEHTKNLWIKVSHELHETVDQKLALESLIEESNVSVKGLEEKLFSAVGLLQRYKSERDEFQIERDNALREAEDLRNQLGQGPLDPRVPIFFSEFSFSDLEKATNHFDPSFKIGEGGYGSIYKGFLRHTEVAIKILNPNSMQGPREFDQEVDVLSKLRHPNLVTLVGACPESWALVYEYLSGGSLEDRIVCKDNAPPLPWQTRIRIATELCSALIFLHSSQPSCIIHGDLKPTNVLLDVNFVCKLSDFGICRVVTHGETSIEQTAMSFTTEPKGTFTYMDPEFLSTGELTPKSDVYSFGIILLRLLTGKSALGISNEVEYALAKGTLDSILDTSAGDWPFVQAEQLAHVALRCCDMNRKNRPDLCSDVWRVLEPMKASCRSLSVLHLSSDNQIPDYFMCPIFQEIMQDPHIATDGFTYEAEAIKGWLDSGHDTSPMTNVKLANHNLTPNRALRSAIQEWLQQHRSI